MKGRMAKTIKEIVDNCGVPEQTVRGWCRRNHVAKGSFAFSKSPPKLDIVPVIRETPFASVSAGGTALCIPRMPKRVPVRGL